jgi:hypothetical protein
MIYVNGNKISNVDNLCLFDYIVIVVYVSKSEYELMQHKSLAVRK